MLPSEMASASQSCPHPCAISMAVKAAFRHTFLEQVDAGGTLSCLRI